MPRTPPYLFVYGSLMRCGDAEARRPLAEGGHFLMEASVPGRLYLAEGWPAAGPAGGPAERVHGEVFELSDPDRILAELDAWEGPGYERRLVPALFKDQGFEIECWAWFWTGPLDESRRIADGRWRPKKKEA
jgi:gamma-glutamylcyclotransferase (GGCT)/AIG2-like uncharacterized protein YtfP